MLSTPEFPAFANKVVAFMHVTTRIPGRTHDGLLQEKGFRGFPSLAFMDAKGEIIAKPQGRSVEGFDATLDALITHANLKQRIDGGEEGLALDLLLVENTLGTVTAADFEARAKACENLTPEQQGKVDQILLDNRVKQLTGEARRGGPALETAATEFLEMLEAGKTPTKGPRVSGGFWMTLGRWATQEADAKLARSVAARMRTDLPGEAYFVNQAKSLDETARRIDALAALEKRVEAGEEGLAPDVLALEYDLGKCNGTVFTEKAEALLEKADANQKATLQSRMREIAFLKHIRFTRDAGERKAAAEALLELLGDDGEPPEKLAGRVWQSLLGYGTQSQDPDLMQRALNGMKKVYKDNPSIAKYATEVEAKIKAIREEKAAEAQGETESDG